MHTLTHRLLELFAGVGRDHRLVVVTGAGISLASGISTFRGSDDGAVWENDVLEKGTARYFHAHPVDSWEWYQKRFGQVLGKQPNPAHDALVELERWHRRRGGAFLLVTQNIDGLHRAAGSGELVEVHGTAARVRCSVFGCLDGAPQGSIDRDDIDLEPFVASPSRLTLPICPSCDAVLRPHVLWFDEYYADHEDFQWQRVVEAAESADFMLFVGTSFAVGVTDLFVRAGSSRGATMVSIDPAPSAPAVPGMITLSAKAEELLPSVMRLL
ncbi:MAG: Sir2 family NAD-dependent protein deacetylase [Acidobacteriota bacterium]